MRQMFHGATGQPDPSQSLTQKIQEAPCAGGCEHLCSNDGSRHPKVFSSEREPGRYLKWKSALMQPSFLSLNSEEM